MCNMDVRSAAKESGVFLYQIADKLGISEPTMVRWLRYELPTEKKTKIMQIISELAAEKKKRHKERRPAVGAVERLE